MESELTGVSFSGIPVKMGGGLDLQGLSHPTGGFLHSGIRRCSPFLIPYRTSKQTPGAGLKYSGLPTGPGMLLKLRWWFRAW